MVGGVTRRRRAVGWVSLVALLTATVAFPGDSAEAGVLPPGGTFLDDDGNIHEGMIEAIAADGITLGCEVVGPLYCPKADVPRDQMASFLARALKLPDSTTDWFDDDDGNTHEANINKVADAGITLGVGGRLYDPKGLVSRAQMASFLARALMLPDSTTNWFTDDEGNTHEANINKVADDGITLGCDSAGNYCPSDNVKRDQMASFLGRALDLEEMIPPPRGTSTDTEAPTWPAGSVLSVTGKSDMTVFVDWSANPATDNEGVFEYDVFVDDVFNKFVAATSTSISGLSPATTYAIRVEARDVAANRSTDGPEVAVTTDSDPDTEAPTWPGGAALTVSGKSNTTMVVDWSANPATDNVGVSSYNVYLDDVFDQSVTGTSANVIALLPNTLYTVRVEAEDTAGNESTAGPLTNATTTQTIELTIDNVFTPADLTVASGSEVTFDNAGGFHSLIWESGSYPGFDSAANAPWQVTFTANTAGAFAYYCSVHGAAGGVGMAGTLTVDP